MCNCRKETKVPSRERDFLIDQRTTRKMQIAGVDKLVTGMMNRRKAREERMEEREQELKRRKSEVKEVLSSGNVTSSNDQ